MGSSRGLGVGLMLAGLAWLLGWAAWLISRVMAGAMDASAGLLGALILALPLGLGLLIAGAILRARAGRESVERADVQFEGRLLSMIETQGSARIPELAAELRVAPEQVRAALYDLVAKRLFTGYVNWEAQRVYAVAASKLPHDRCPHCGAKLELGGKDTVVCPYCRSEIFLPHEHGPG